VKTWLPCLQKWHEVNPVRRDWRPEKRTRHRLPPSEEFVYVDPRTYYIGAQCAANKKRRDNNT